MSRAAPGAPRAADGLAAEPAPAASQALRWDGGDPSARAAVEAWLAGTLAGEVLRDNPRRRIVRLPGARGDLVVKHFRLASGRHPRRERLKRWLGRSPAHREWTALRVLHAAGVPVPEPLARGRLGGDALLVVRFVAGASLERVARRPARERRAALAALARSVTALHAAGFAHRDLHHGNLLFADDRAVLLDLQSAGWARPDDALRDLGDLDYSLWPYLSAADRLRLGTAVLGAGHPPSARDRSRLRAIGRAARRRAAEHARSRTRRCLRPGRRFASLRLGRARGLHLRELSAGTLEALVAFHHEALAAGDARVLKGDPRSRITRVAAGGRRAVVKETPARTPWRALADLFRGSAGRRAWRGGHGLAARGVGAAQPWAFLEERRLGLPVRSLVVLEDLAPDEPADAAHALPAADVVAALGRLATRLHERGVHHGDLKASHVFVAERAGGGVAARLIDLDGTRFPRRLRDDQRIQSLAELNASLPDRFPDSERSRAFARYAARLPFTDGARAARAEIVRRSLARAHRWSGRGCQG